MFFVCFQFKNLTLETKQKTRFSFSFVVVCCFVFRLLAVRFPLAFDRKKKMIRGEIGTVSKARNTTVAEFNCTEKKLVFEIVFFFK